MDKFSPDILLIKYIIFWCLLMEYKINANNIEIPITPCPEFFIYRFNGRQYNGFLQVPSLQLGETLKIDVYLSLGAELYTSDVGSLDLQYSFSETLQNIYYGQPIQYNIRFPIQTKLPKITYITYNNRIICRGPEEKGPIVTSIHLDYILYSEYRKNNEISKFKDKNNFNNYGNGFYHYQDINSNLNPTRNNNNQLETKPTYDQSRNYDPYYSVPMDTLNQNTMSENTLPQTTINQDMLTQTMMMPQDMLAQNTAPEEPLTKPRFDSKDNDICGLPDNRYSISPLVVGGQIVTRGTWPWLAAVYVSDLSSLSFQCGGNLVSNKVVITAAHCLTSSKKVYQAHEVFVYLGRYNIRRWEREEGSEIRESSVLVPHPDYMRGTSFDADIGIIILKTPVEYNQYVRPICLWNGPSDISVVEGKMGTVVGWGYDETGNVTPEPRKKQIPVVEESTCLRSGETFRLVTSNRTFCAGNRDGTGPCNGDSGSGMAIRWNNRWTLRGLVSVAAFDPIKNVCNLKEYIVFTDTAKFVDWIKSFLPDLPV